MAMLNYQRVFIAAVSAPLFGAPNGTHPLARASADAPLRSPKRSHRANQCCGSVVRTLKAP